MTCATSTAIAGFADPTPGGLDVPYMIGAWSGMLVTIAAFYDIPINPKSITNTLTSALGTAALYVGGAKLFATALKYTGVGTLAGCIINAILNGVFTCRVGGLYKSCWAKGDEWPTVKEISNALINSVTFTSIGQLATATGSAAKGRSWANKEDRNAIFQQIFSAFID